jgi:hypothetical protein
MDAAPGQGRPPPARCIRAMELAAGGRSWMIDAIEPRPGPVRTGKEE